MITRTAYDSHNKAGRRLCVQCGDALATGCASAVWDADRDGGHDPSVSSAD